MSSENCVNEVVEKARQQYIETLQEGPITVGEKVFFLSKRIISDVSCRRHLTYLGETALEVHLWDAANETASEEHQMLTVAELLPALAPRDKVDLTAVSA